MAQLSSCPGQRGLTVSRQRVFLVCVLWACGSPSGKGRAHRSGGGFKVPSHGLWLLTCERSL